jgi:heme oxygenase
LKTHIFHLSEKDAEWDSKDGLHFYHFENIGIVPEFKDMYRERLNAARVDADTRGKDNGAIITLNKLLICPL